MRWVNGVCKVNPKNPQCDYLFTCYTTGRPAIGDDRMQPCELNCGREKGDEPRDEDEPSDVFVSCDDLVPVK